MPGSEAVAFDLAALHLLGDGATAAELAARFAGCDEVRRPAGAAALLDRLTRLGLARVAIGEGAAARYVLTSLGQHYLETSLGGSATVEAQLAELERLRTDLLSTIAHELRTPLTAVRTCVGLLLDPTVRPDPATQEQLLTTIARSSERMQRLVSDILDLTRLRSGRFQLQLRRFKARELARDAVAALAPLLEASGKSLQLALPDAPVWVYGDRRRLEQALLNLLSNAHRFAPVGEPIRLTVEVDGRDVLWSVADRGPGITTEDQSRLFERFFTRASDSAGRSGTGLGLPIALAIAQAHGGTIGVVSAVGSGSTFTLRVPVEGPPQEPG